MSLSPTQIEDVREIIDISSIETTETLLSVLNSAQEVKTIADITEWNKIANRFGKIAGGKLGYYNDKDPKRLAIRNRVRRRLGLPTVASAEDLTENCNNIAVFHPTEPWKC